jgi:hypothetical protein
MKFLIFICLFSFSVLAFEKVELSNVQVYVPNGNDSNDLVQVSVAGSLPDTCHHNPSFEVLKNGNTFTIKTFSYFTALDDGCRKIAIPFLETVNLGILKKGDYLIKTTRSSMKKSAKLMIKEAEVSLQDEFFYGNVTNIFEDPEDREIHLVGVNPTNCLKFDSLDAEIQEAVIVLRPKFVENGNCEEVPTHFELTYQVPRLPTHPRGLLLHVRAMGGKSISLLFQNKI